MERGSRPAQAVAEGQAKSEAAKQEKSFASLKAFVQESMRAGVHLAVPVTTSQNEEQWNRQWQILGLYINTSATYEEVGKVFGSTRQNIQIVVKATVHRLFNASPEDIQERYPVASFSYRKPHNLERSLSQSEKRGGSLREAAKLLQTGHTMQEISRSLGVNVTLFRKDRQIGSLVTSDNYILRRQSPEFRNSLRALNDPTSTRESRQKLLDQLGWHAIYRPDASNVIRLSKLLKESGVNVIGSQRNLDIVIHVLRNVGIPFRIFEKTAGHTKRYGVVPFADRESVLEVLRSASQLSHLRKTN